MRERMVDVNVASAHGILRPNAWPDERTYGGRWCHSDMRDVAYFYVFKFYEKVIEKGNLK